jgi:hypothetical protein
MNSSQSQEEVTSRGPARDLDADARSDQRIRPIRPSIHPDRSFGRTDDRAAIERPSIGKRIVRTLTRFSVAVLIGVGGTLAWQAYGDEAKEMAVTRAPSLGWWLSASKTKPAAAVAATSPDLTQQLAPLAQNLDAMRRSVEQLAARQEQLAQNVATLQAVGQDIRERVSAPPQQAASSPQPKPSQPRAPSPAAAQASSASASAPPPRPSSRSPLRLLDSPAQSEQ